MSSVSSSGTSTPRGSMTPPPLPDPAGPNPLTVGTHFVKQYYKVLSTTPEQIFRFYQPSSVLSQGVGSQPTQPATLGSTTNTNNNINVKDRFVLEGHENCPIRFEFEHGAIDAQVSVNGGVLLVVTGHIVYLDSANNYEQEDAAASTTTTPDVVDSNKRKAFVHTFFLGSMTAGQKRSYYVHNDILRFLHDDEEKTVVASNKSQEKSRKVEVVQLPASVEEPPAEVVQKAAAAAAALTPVKRAVLDDEAPGGGVEETKEPLPDEEVVVKEEVPLMDAKEAATDAVKLEPEPAVVSDTEKEVVIESLDKVGGAVAPAAKEEKSKPAAAKPTPGSWASLVASGGGGGGGGSISVGGSTPATPTRGTPVRAAASPVKPKPSSPAAKTPAPTTPPAPAADSSKLDGARPKHVKRDPDCTLVIKNIDSETKESDVLGLFEPYAVKADAKVVGITVSAHKGIAFVDYDSAAPVLAAVEQHQKEHFQINGRELDIYQKTLEQRSRRPSGGRGSFRGGQPGNGSTSRGGGGGSAGRQQVRRGGRGERDRGGERDRRGGR